MPKVGEGVKMLGCVFAIGTFNSPVILNGYQGRTGNILSALDIRRIIPYLPTLPYLTNT